MENSFFEYRDKTGVISESDSEIIDASLVVDDSFTSKKKNHTVYVPDSDASLTDDDSHSERDTHTPARTSNASSGRKTSRRLSKQSHNDTVSSSSDEDMHQASPELTPRRPPSAIKAIFYTPKPGFKNKRKQFDSDLDNSIVEKHDNNRKLTCLKNTPLKIDNEIKTPNCINVDGMASEDKARISDSDTGEKHSKNDDEDDDSSDDDQPLSHLRKDKTKSLNPTEMNEVIVTSDDVVKNSHDNISNNDCEETAVDNSHDNISNNDCEETVVDNSHDNISNNDCEETAVDNSHDNISNNDCEETAVDSSHDNISNNDCEETAVDNSHDNISNNDCEETAVGSSHGNISNNDSETADDDNDDGGNYISSDERKSPINRNAIIDSDDERILKSAKKRNNRKVISSDDEDELVMSRATRMSIMGIPAKCDYSDESSFIQSDDSPRESTNSTPDLPDAALPTYKTPTKTTEPVGETTRLTCSPFSSPLHDITNEILDSHENTPKTQSGSGITNAMENLKNKVLNKLITDKVMEEKENVAGDDDVTIITIPHEIISLSSDDDDEVSIVPTSPNLKKSPKGRSPNSKKSPKLKIEDTSPKRKRDNTIKSYLAPPSYPNQGVVYVKKQIRENELSKLNSLKEDLHNVRNLLEQIDINTLPDGGVKYIERLTALEAEVRRQGEKVANMVVEPEYPTAEEIANDGFEKGLTWDEIQKASNAVQPRMFGKQAMSTHMAERGVILERLRDLHASLASRPPESQQAPPPRALATPLMPHQLHALAWLRWRETQRPRAGILADDMGLGKTITMIALIVSDKERNIDDGDSDDEQPPKGSKIVRGGTLVVCPASLMQQWGGEVSRHCSAHALRVLLHHGPSRATQPQRLAGYDIVVTTYNILQREADKKGILMSVRWRRVILDEAHIVRNHKSATSVAVSQLSAQRRWCLTGTPVQNKDLDLYALIKFLRCTPFDDLTMWKKWIDNKSLGGQERLSTIMRCLLLRRTKSQLQQRGQLACLPQRTAHQLEVTLNTHEMNVYQKVLVFSKTLFAQFLHQRAEKNSDGLTVVRPDKDSEYTKMHKKMIALQGAKPVKSHEILVLLLRLRQVCCHCGLIAAMLDHEATGPVDEDPAGKDLLAELNKLTLDDSRRKSGGKKQEEEEQEEPEEGTTAAEAIRSVLDPNNPVFELTRPSSKIHAVMKCLNENVFPNKGHKAVVVSQWTSVLRLVERELSNARVRTVTLSGNVPVPARPPLINALNDDKSDVRVMLLSLCAGGVGLNLCGANHLLLLDPHWNPQLEEQAQDRIYRVGQTKHVHIYRFMCVDTVEQSIRKLQQAKLELAENVLTGARHTNASKLTIEDLKMLFNMGPQ